MTRFHAHLFAVGLLSGCAGSASQTAPTTVAGQDRHQDHGHGESPMGEREAHEQARPVFERYCAGCHTSAAGKAAALEHFSMDGYPFGGHHADNIAATIREVLGAAGKAATMPKDRPGVVKGDELRRVLEWADAFDREHSAEHMPHHDGEGEGEHHGGGGDDHHHDGDHHHAE